MKKFYLGMDIGTDSVGMACTDENYDLLRAKGKDLWSVRLFDEANSAQERRVKRSARRRLARRKQRVALLQSIFAPFMQDDKFFLRLNNSGFYEEDKDFSLKTRFSLFADENYTDVEFYKEYPTVFHLRDALIVGKVHDLRHYYLALHHIIKYRGHFLFEGENLGNIGDIKQLFIKFNALLDEIALEEDLRLNSEKGEEFLSLALSKRSLTEKVKEAAVVFGVTVSTKKDWLALMLGSKVAPKKLFGAEFEEKYAEEKSFSFKGMQDEAFESLADTFDDEHFSLLAIAREVYNLTVFTKVLGGKSVSRAMIAIYEKHSADLKLLKDFIKDNFDKSVYHKVFRSRVEKANYVNYIGYNVRKSKKQNVDKCKAEDFYAFLKKTLSVKFEDEKAESIRLQILDESAQGSFLPKIINADNGLFPHQINGVELDAILHNLCKDYPQFSQKDESGFSHAEKIRKIFEKK